jgi:hypothetical protein
LQAALSGKAIHGKIQAEEQAEPPQAELTDLTAEQALFVDIQAMELEMSRPEAAGHLRLLQEQLAAGHPPPQKTLMAQEQDKAAWLLTAHTAQPKAQEQHQKHLQALKAQNQPLLPQKQLVRHIQVQQAMIMTKQPAMEAFHTHVMIHMVIQSPAPNNNNNKV